MVDSNPMWPFLAREARSLGIPRSRLYSSAYRTVLHGVMVDAKVPDTVVVRGRAALLVSPEGGVLSHWTAARLWGGRVPDNDFVHVSFMRRVRFRVRSVKPHCFTYRLHVVRRHGLPVTSPLQTFCHLAGHLGLVDLVALGDSLLRKNRFSRAELASFCGAWEGQHRDQAMAAARLVRDHVDSSPESALRVLLVLAGFPEPQVNIPVYDDDDNVRFRIDLGYEELRLAIEYDGRWHATPEQKAHDEVRRTTLSSEEHWTFVIVEADELYGATADLVMRLFAELTKAGVVMSRPPRDDWRAYFRVVRVAA